MGRKSSHCGNMDHNSRTCTTQGVLVGGLRLFGVQLDISSSSPSPSSSIAMKKSFSLDCLSASSTPSSRFSSTSSRLPINENSDKMPNGYLSDGLIGGRTQGRKKGVPWTEEEHKIFLVGLTKLGKGDWRGISRNFVTTRTPCQVASHARKYFLRRNSLKSKKHRSRLFDVVGKEKLAARTVDAIACNFVSNEPSISWGVSQKANDSVMVGFHSRSTEEQVCKASKDNSMTVWDYGSLELESTASILTESTVQNSAPDLELTLAAPDLELTLAAPMAMNQSKSSTTGSLLGVSV